MSSLENVRRTLARSVISTARTCARLRRSRLAFSFSGRTISYSATVFSGRFDRVNFRNTNQKVRVRRILVFLSAPEVRNPNTYTICVAATISFIVAPGLYMKRLFGNNRRRRRVPRRNIRVWSGRKTFIFDTNRYRFRLKTHRATINTAHGNRGWSNNSNNVPFP